MPPCRRSNFCKRIAKFFAGFSAGAEERQDERNHYADHDAGHNGEVETAVSALDPDVPRQVPEADAHPLRENENQSGYNQQYAGSDQQTPHWPQHRSKAVDNRTLTGPLHHTYLKQLFESMDVGVLIADDSAVYVDANRAACALYGRDSSAIVGHHLSEFIEGARRQEVDLQWKAFLRDGFQSGVFAIQMPDGTSRSFRFQARANFTEGLHCSFVTPLNEQDHAAGTLTMCAWTRRILIGGQWLPIEDYLKSVHGVSVSHGISPDAFALWNSPDSHG